MSLTLTVVRYQSTRPDRDITVSVPQGGCTLGRSAKGDLVLPDPSRTISSRHARIEHRDGRYWLTDESTNGTTVNQAPAPVGKDNTVALSDGDTLTIGAYEISVSIREDAAPAAALGPLEDMEDETPDPLDLIGTTGAPARQGTGAAAGGGLIPDDDWGEPGGGGGGLIPDDFDLGGGIGGHAGGDPVLDQGSAAQDAFTPPGAIPADPGPLDTPTAPSPEAAAPPPPRAAPVGAGGGQADLALRAFFRALGLKDEDVPPEAWDRVMENSGGVLREAVAGLMRVLAARTAFKRELRMDVTIIQPAENNPLKFSVDADDALRYLIVREARGFLPPVQAVQEGYMDVQAHQLALMSALKAALQSLVGRFEPRTLEQGFQKQSKLDQLVPMARKAKCWDVFTETYDKIAKDAHDGFMELLDHAFTEAYEKQIRELKDPRRSH